jgi:hypothetical protein
MRSQRGVLSGMRRSLLIDFANVAGSHDADRIGATWVRHHHELMGARGIFVVEDSKHELIVPGDRHFATTGFLRCLMGSTRLLNIQNKDGAREFRYSAPIFCDEFHQLLRNIFQRWRSKGQC